MKKYIFGFLVFLLLNGCDKKESEPFVQACFDFYPDTLLYVGDTISFINCSKNSTDFIWDFGDNFTSREKEPRHIYSKEGLFIIKLLSLNKSSHDSIFKTVDIKNHDYRDVFLGNYIFTIHQKFPSTNAWVLNPIDTIYQYAGSVNKILNYKNKIIVDWGNNIILTTMDTVYSQKSDLTIDSLGNLIYPEFHASGHTWFYGPAYVKNDTIKFNFLVGGLGAWTTWNIYGLRQNK